MKSMRAQSILYALALLLVSGLGATAAVEYEDYTNPAGTKFPIAIYDNVPISINRVQILSDAEQKAYFDSIRLAGFNVELWGKGDIWRKEPINKWTPYLKSIGMNTIISTRGFSLTRSATPYDPNTPDSILLQDNWDGLKTVISNYSQDPNVWGYWACDEPGMKNLHKPVYELNPYEAAVIPTFNRIHRFRGDKVAYANFAAAAAPSVIGDFYTDNLKYPHPDVYVPNFENFLDHMVDVLGLKFLTFDLYPVISNKIGQEPEWIIKNHYYYFMDLYGRYCRDRKIPVWLVMLSVEHSYDGPGEENDWTYPEITEGLLRLQAMNGLAFGMKGLAYWEYGAQNKMSGNTLYKSALYDINKKQKTPAWNAARTVNNEVAQYGNILQHATYDRSRIAVKDSLLSGTTPKDSVPPFHGFEKFTGSFERVVGLTYAGMGVLMSHLTDDNYHYIAVVSQDHLKSQHITVKFDPNVNFERVIIADFANVNGFGQFEDSKKHQSSLILKPGEMALFRYKK